MKNTIKSVTDQLVIPCADVEIGTRHRQDMGDLQTLADSIEAVGLLQPIVITGRNKLVCGERRLRAVRDLLKWDTIKATVVDIESIASGEFAENEIRKEFTASERVAIAAAVKAEVGERRGGRLNRRVQTKGDKCPICEPGKRTAELAAKQAGFSNRKALERAEWVVEVGTPQLVAAMDDGKVSISRAAEIAALPKEEQDTALAEILASPGKVVRPARSNDEPAKLDEMIAQIQGLIMMALRQVSTEIAERAEKYGESVDSSPLAAVRSRLLSARTSMAKATKSLNQHNVAIQADGKDSTTTSSEDRDAS